MEPYHLEREELEYELNLRGVTEISGTRRNLAKMVADELRVEKVDGVVYEWSPWLIDYDLNRCEKHLADMNRMIHDEENFEYLPRELYSRLLHYEARLQRLQPMGHEVVEVVNLKRRLQEMIQTISAKIEQMATRPRLSLTPARPVPTQNPGTREGTLGNRAYVSTPNLRLSNQDDRADGSPPSYSGEEMVEEEELEGERIRRINRETPWRHALTGRGARGGASSDPARVSAPLKPSGEGGVAQRRQASLRDWSSENDTARELNPRGRLSTQSFGTGREAFKNIAPGEEMVGSASAQRSQLEDHRPTQRTEDGAAAPAANPPHH